MGLDRFLQAHPSGYHPFAEIPPDWKDDKSKPAQDVRMNNENENTEEDEGEVEQMDEFPSTPPPGFADPSSYTEDEIDRLVVLMKGGIGRKSRVVPLGVSRCPQCSGESLWNGEVFCLLTEQMSRRCNSFSPKQSRVKCARW